MSALLTTSPSALDLVSSQKLLRLPEAAMVQNCAHELNLKSSVQTLLIAMAWFA